MTRQIDIEGILSRLIAAQFAFVIIGGIAAVAHGATVNTFDLDVCCDFSPENLTRLQTAISDLHPIHRMTPQKLPLEITPKNAKDLRNLYLHTDLGVLDCLSEVAGIGNYSDVFAASVEIDFAGGRCRVLDIAPLIKAKQTVNRLQDKIAIVQLLAIKERQHGNRN